MAALEHDSPTVAGAERVASLRSVLIGAQVAMSFVLLVGAGLFLRTLSNLQTIDTGFDRGRVLVASIDPSLNGYDAPRSAAALTEFVQRVEQVPGIRHAGLSSVSPITGSWDVNDLTVPGYQPKDGEEVNASFAAVTPGYLEAMGIALREGRALTWRDTESVQRVAVINETMAREYFPGGSAVGRHFSFGGEKEPTEVVGVVRDGKYVTLREDRAPRFAYVPFLQRTLSGAEMVLHARTDGDPLGRVDAVRQQLRAIDVTLPLSDVTTLDDQIAESLSSEPDPGDARVVVRRAGAPARGGRRVRHPRIRRRAPDPRDWPPDGARCGTGRRVMADRVAVGGDRSRRSAWRRGRRVGAPGCAADDGLRREPGRPCRVCRRRGDRRSDLGDRGVAAGAPRRSPRPGGGASSVAGRAGDRRDGRAE